MTSNLRSLPTTSELLFALWHLAAGFLHVSQRLKFEKATENFYSALL